MMGDDNENVRNVGVAEVLALRKQVTEESANNDDSPHLPNSSSIRPPSPINKNALLKTAEKCLFLNFGLPKSTSLAPALVSAPHICYKHKIDLCSSR